jgi:catechol 2,3-dioxygenase-like lactoylglutathione lyase family enzyme
MSDSATTSGIDHIGLTVSDLAASTGFFTECLGWAEGAAAVTASTEETLAHDRVG